MTKMENLLEALEHRQIVAYFHFAGATILLYDYFLTLSKEVSLVWPAPSTPTKYLFLVTRYLPFIDASVILYHQVMPNAKTRTCEITFHLTGWMFLAGITLAEVILTIRAWAVWGRDRRLTIGLPVFMALCYIPLYAVLGVFLNSVKFSPLPSHLPGCLITAASPILSIGWILIMVYEAGIFFLMLQKGIQTYRQNGNTRLFRVVFRDGLVYYMYIFALSLANVIIVLASQRDLSNMLSSIERAVHAILTCRVLLSIKSQASKGPLPNGITPTRTPPIRLRPVAALSVLQSPQALSPAERLHVPSGYSFLE